jgi:hypothetical protein
MGVSAETVTTMCWVIAKRETSSSPADWPFVAKQNHPHSIVLPYAMRAIECVANRRFPDVQLELGRLVGPRFLDGFSNWLKNMVGTRRLELLTSTVSKRRFAVTHYTLTALTASL